MGDGQGVAGLAQRGGEATRMSDLRAFFTVVGTKRVGGAGQRGGWQVGRVHKSPMASPCSSSGTTPAQKGIKHALRSFGTTPTPRSAFKSPPLQRKHLLSEEDFDQTSTTKRSNFLTDLCPFLADLLPQPHSDQCP